MVETASTRSSPLAHRLMPQRTNDDSYEETDPFFLWAESLWIGPCTAQLPRYLHGLCLYLPAFALMFTLVMSVALLAYCNNPSKEAPPLAQKKKTKKTE